MGLSSFVPAQLIAQSWCPPEARWKYDMGHPWGFTSENLIFCGGDTLINGDLATKIMRSTITTQLMGFDTLLTSTGLYVITRENQGVIYQWSHNEFSWDTLFWFSANPGDHWTPPFADLDNCPGLKLHVLDTSTVVVDGVPLRQLHVQQFDEIFEYSDQFFIRERFGYYNMYFHFIPTCEGIFECYCQFLCYSDTEIYPGGCDHTLDLNEESLDNGIELYPNPGNDSFILRSTSNERTTIQICDMTGRLIEGPIEFFDHVQMDMSDSPPGIYLVTLQSVSTPMVKRWIKQ